MSQILEGLQKRQFPVPRDGGAFASLVYIEDAAAATVAALDRSAPGQVYNIVDDEPVRWGVLIDAFAAAFGLPKPRRVPGALLRLAAPYMGGLMTRQSLRLSNAKAKADLGWRPTMPTYREGIEALLAELRPTRDGETEGVRP
jgi:nucleoside-diphosphate-sugar epimerase